MNRFYFADSGGGSNDLMSDWGGFDDMGDSDDLSTPSRTPKRDRFAEYGMSDGFGSRNQPPTKHLTPEERVDLVKDLFLKILNREADTRDINYYKYSTLTRDEIIDQLLTGKEHKKLITNGSDYSAMQQRAEQAEARVRMLEAQLKDQAEEFNGLTALLKEKNNYIQQLRAKANPFRLDAPVTQVPDTKTHESVKVENVSTNQYNPQQTAPQNFTSSESYKDAGVRSAQVKKQSLPDRIINFISDIISI